MNPILEVRGVEKSFAGYKALQDVHFTVASGEIISVLGPSGCGKSTLLQLIAGLQQPDKGEILLRGERVASAATLLPPEKRNINMVFQDYALWPHMTVFDNIAYGLRRKKTPAGAMKEKVAELVHLLHLTGLEDRLPPQLSGGQQQRVAIARSLATQPDLILLDEPLSNLDMRLRVEMRTEMAYLFRRLGTTVFHVTHDPDEAFAMADRLIIMRAGAIDQIGDPQKCYYHPASKSAASLLGAGNSLRGRGILQNGNPAVKVNDTTTIEGTSNNFAAWQEGREGEVLFRAEQAEWLQEPRLTHAGGADQPAGNLVEAHIVHSAFEGSRWRILAETKDRQSFTFFHSERLESGIIGWIFLPSEAAYLFQLEKER